MEQRVAPIVVFILLCVTNWQQVLGQCPQNLYRTFDGSCNNLQNPSSGAANTQFTRLIPAKYSDGKSRPAVATDGSELPSARLLSVEVFQEGVQNSPEFTLANMQFGQIVAHDMALTRGGKVESRCFAINCLVVLTVVYNPHEDQGA
uniref:Peroxidase n=1 Tax=Anopheles maculatus TaxID=74869 RepID=A0A182SDD4_9DIPT